MGHQSDTEVLAQRLDALRTEKATLMKRVEELSADEQRINYALDVFRSVVADIAQAAEPKRDVSLSAHAIVNTTATGTLTVGPAVQPGAQEAQRTRQSLESVILEVFSDKTGLTSGEVADRVGQFSDAKRNSILSTLSRMGGKGLVRRAGKLYFVVTKSEGPEAGTSEPSVFATTSGDGQHTSGALTGEEREDL